MVVKLLAMYGEENRMAKVLARGKLAPLIYAVCNGHIEIVKLLAPIPRSCVAPPQGSGMRRQYLGDALLASVIAIAGNLEISQCLIMEGADINFVGDHTDASPIFYAAGAGDLGVVQLLLASGADPNLGTRDRSRPLFNAARAANLDVARALITAGANIHATDRRLRNVLAYLAEKNVGKMSRFFLERGVDPNHEDEDGETPLHHACSMHNAGSARALVELLLEFGAATVEKASTYGITPVHMAMHEDNWEIVKILEPLVQNPKLRAEIDAWRNRTSLSSR
ncbi:ankyrin repeat-containing domain protein [Mycena olivaceomarginata]|nr:ankyrin repeat-containing domain protein [Mycena olivaceomarginata]